MKKSLLILLLFLPLISKGQNGALPKDKATGKIAFEGAAQVTGTTKAELYTRAREWFAQYYRAVEAQMVTDDREAGKLVGNTYRDVQRQILSGTGPAKINTQLWFTISIQVKDGRYTYTIKNFKYEDQPGQPAIPLETTGAVQALPAKLLKKDGTPTPEGLKAKKQADLERASILSAMQTTITALKEAMAQPVPEKDW